MSLTFTDRSRYLRGLKHCPRARFLAYHYKGVGIRNREEAVPLATGTAVHWPITMALAQMAAIGQLPAREEMRGWIEKGTETFKTRVAARGFDEGVEEQVSWLVGEQAQLIEGLCWVAFRKFLPWLHSEFKVLAVEREETAVMGCGCGLGDQIGEAEDHETRGCDGVVVMSRPDFLVERRSDGVVCMMDLKTSAYAPRDPKGEDHMVQMAFGTLGAERRLGKEVGAYYVVSLIKGQRAVPYALKGEAGAVKRQESQICYGWWKEQNPPFDQGGWGWERKKGFEKVPLWVSPFAQKSAAKVGMGVAEWWVMEEMPEEVAEELLEVSPPFQRPRNLLGALVEEVVGEEKEWAWKLQHINAEKGMQDPELNGMIRRSWDCHNFYGRSCEFVGVCSQGSGWENPEGLGRFVAREMHHGPEAQMRGRSVQDLEKMGFSVAAGEEGEE